MSTRNTHQETRHGAGHTVRAGHGNFEPCACSACSAVYVSNDIDISDEGDINNDDNASNGNKHNIYDEGIANQDAQHDINQSQFLTKITVNSNFLKNKSVDFSKVFFGVAQRKNCR